jgi:hypothetical protein
VAVRVKLCYAGDICIDFLPSAGGCFSLGETHLLLLNAYYVEFVLYREYIQYDEDLEGDPNLVLNWGKLIVEIGA